MLAAVTSWALSKTGAATLAIVGVLLAFGLQGALLHHANAQLADLRAADRAAAAAARAQDAAAARISHAARVEVAQARVEVRTVTRTLIEKVPAYVPPAADRECVVPAGFVQLHDAAAAGLPGPAGGPVEAASGVPLSAVLATVVGNYGAAYDWRAEALGWRSWYVAQRAVWDTPAAAPQH